MLRIFSFTLGLLGLWFCGWAAMLIPADMFIHGGARGVLLAALKVLGMYAPSVACILIVIALIVVWRNARRASGLFLSAAGLFALSVFCAIVLRILSGASTLAQAAHGTLVIMGAVTTFPILLMAGAALAAYLAPKLSAPHEHK